MNWTWPVPRASCIGIIGHQPATRRIPRHISKNPLYQNRPSLWWIQSIVWIWWLAEMLKAVSGVFIFFWQFLVFGQHGQRPNPQDSVLYLAREFDFELFHLNCIQIATSNSFTALPPCFPYIFPSTMAFSPCFRPGFALGPEAPQLFAKAALRARLARLGPAALSPAERSAAEEPPRPASGGAQPPGWVMGIFPFFGGKVMEKLPPKNHGLYVFFGWKIMKHVTQIMDESWWILHWVMGFSPPNMDGLFQVFSLGWFPPRNTFPDGFSIINHPFWGTPTGATYWC